MVMLNPKKAFATFEYMTDAAEGVKKKGTDDLILKFFFL